MCRSLSPEGKMVNHVLKEMSNFWVVYCMLDSLKLIELGLGRRFETPLMIGLANSQIKMAKYFRKSQGYKFFKVV